MKKVVYLLFGVLSYFCASCSCEGSSGNDYLYRVDSGDNGSNTTRAGIMAEDFVKEKVISAKDLEFDLEGVDEESRNEYHVVANIKTMNGMGLMVPRKVSVRLRYDGGEWEDKSSWTVISIKALNPSTGESESW